MLAIEFGVAKVNKYASRESGDTFEIVERPTGNGGFSAVLVDGQGSGRAAKTLSNLVTTKAISLLKDGVRDGAVARAVSDYLLAYRYGQVSATLNIISADFSTRSLVMTRNNPVASYVIHLPTPTNQLNEPHFELLAEPSVPIGLYPRTRPIVQEWMLEAGLLAISYTDGIPNAGEHYGEHLNIPAVLQHLLQTTTNPLSAQALADALLAAALQLDKQRPADDMGVVVLQVVDSEANDVVPTPRRLSLQAILP
jgi:hypothetical protein